MPHVKTINLDDKVGPFIYKGACREWKSTCTNAAGNYQSPVNMLSRQAVYDASLEDSALTFHYSTSRETDILNNGHTLAVFPQAKQSVCGGPMPPGNDYELAEICFHWGKSNSRGSEHTVNGKAFPMEVQLVHWNSSLYESIKDAAGKPHGVVIVALFTQLGREHPSLRIITDNLEDVQFKGRQKTITAPFNPSSLLPDPSLRDYWTYEGSLTAPPCCEGVTWVIFRYPLMISHTQLEDFRRLRTITKGDQPRSGDDGMMVNNFRPTQPMADRVLRASFQS
ncbi:carbonic anhydrase-related protein-like isoform X2 [Gigantopelta aegis]|uniref:carbonic anhydrase-related protein-like isoform X2 n=1 Tax=Gigantopelta aegis TaxID=1735272 RepID=UPI001B88922D|nr:carbonic anhydrase-related protein-like isoform X2 [Gigantopelta aegis]